MKYVNITNRRGDGGYTDLCLGGRVVKTDSRMDTVGDIDEFNSVLGLCHPYLLMKPQVLNFEKYIMIIQHDLTSIMGEVATADENKDRYIEKFGGISEKNIQTLDFILSHCGEYLDDKGKSQDGWSVYGKKGEASARFHHATTVCRRCERKILDLQFSGYEIREELIRYFNRLSKVLYIIAIVYEK